MTDLWGIEFSTQYSWIQGSTVGSMIPGPDLHLKGHLAPLLYSKRPGYFDPGIRNVSFNHFPHDRFIKDPNFFGPNIVGFTAPDPAQTIPGPVLHPRRPLVPLLYEL